MKTRFQPGFCRFDKQKSRTFLLPANEKRLALARRDCDLWPLSALALMWTWPPLGGSERRSLISFESRRERSFVNRKRPVSTGRVGESEAKTKSPHRIRAERLDYVCASTHSAFFLQASTDLSKAAFSSALILTSRIFSTPFAPTTTGTPQ